YFALLVGAVTAKYRVDCPHKKGKISGMNKRSGWLRAILNFSLSIAALNLTFNTSHGFDLRAFSTPPGQQTTSVRYAGTLKRDFHHQSLNVTAPLYKDDSNAVLLSPRIVWFDLVPNNSAVPDLYDFQIGATYMRQTARQHVWSIQSTYGSASNKPFKDSSVTTVSGLASYRFPTSSASTWSFFLQYSNNRPILNGWPLPGFAYTYVPSKDFRATFGVPFASLYWKYADHWSVNLFTLAPWVARLQNNYIIGGPIQVFAGGELSQATFLLHGRADKKERFYYDEKKAFIGFQSPLSAALMGELEAGISDDRRFFSSKKYRPNPSPRTDLGASGYGKLTLSARL
ncbi:MAG TPA: hypothetical protein PLH57_04595, partial [Oligoflexia bacterium]|nr:hypothetical protein [Oligoflexia bacterium]